VWAALVPGSTVAATPAGRSTGKLIAMSADVSAGVVSGVAR